MADVIIEKKEWKIHRNDEAKETLRSLPDWYYMMWLRKWPKRTLEQNKYYRELLTVIWNDIWYEKDELHAYFKFLFLRQTHIHEILWEYTEIISTTKLTIKNFKDYIDKIVNRCLEHWYEIPLEPR